MPVKRISFFLLWTFVFWMFAIFIGGKVTNMKRYFSQVDLTQQDFGKALRDDARIAVGARHGSYTFLRSYWHVTLAGAALIAGAGSLPGVLPGTGKLKLSEPPPLPVF